MSEADVLDDERWFWKRLDDWLISSPVGGRYTLLRPLARGGFSCVWLARDEESGAEVALKILQARLEEQRFEREHRLLSRIEHRQVVRSLDYGREGALQIPYMVLELVSGPHLDQHLAELRRGPEPAVRTLEVMRDLARVVHEACHLDRIHHRDLKPGNILVRDGRPVLIDFGTARRETDEKLTSHRSAGTQGFMAPEHREPERARPARGATCGRWARSCGTASRSFRRGAWWGPGRAWRGCRVPFAPGCAAS